MIIKRILEQKKIEKNSLGDYESGIGIEISKSDLNRKKESNAKSKSIQGLSPPKCRACGSITHRLTSHRDCSFDAKKKEKKEKERCKIVPSKSKQCKRKKWKDEFHHQLNDTNKANQVASIMINLS